MKLFGSGSIFYSDVKDVCKIKTIEEFFYAAQEKTGLFQYEYNGSRIPYKLYDRQKEWFSLYDKDKPQRRALLASRDKGKSELVSILGVAWQIYNDNKIKIGIMSFKFENAEKILNQVLKILSAFDIPIFHKSGGYYTDDSDGHTPNLMAMGLMSTVRGMHFDYLIMDDPLTINEQFSKKYITRSRYFLNEGASIAKRIILIGQLITRNDIFYDAFGDSTGNYYVMQSWHGDIPELDKDIDYLKATIGKKDVARNYLGYIDDVEEAIFRSIQFDDSKPSGNTYAFIDPSAKGKDYTAIAIGWRSSDARIIIYGQIFKAHWGNCLDQIIEMCTGCRIVYYEDNQGTALGTFLREKGLKKTMGITSTSNKIAKIYSLRGLILTDRLRLHNSMDAFSVMQVKDWTETAEHDDLPDAMAMLVQRMGWILPK